MMKPIFLVSSPNWDGTFTLLSYLKSEKEREMIGFYHILKIPVPVSGSLASLEGTSTAVENWC